MSKLTCTLSPACVSCSPAGTNVWPFSTSPVTDWHDVRCSSSRCWCDGVLASVWNWKPLQILAKEPLVLNASMQQLMADVRLDQAATMGAGRPAAGAHCASGEWHWAVRAPAV